MAHAAHSYVPRLLQERLAASTPIVGAESSRFHAAMMLTDIVGFTAMVESFAAEGRPGLEQLTWSLNDYFATLVDHVHTHGGDVLCIAGDAFLCCWPALPDDTPGAAVQRAVHAGLTLQHDLHERDAGGGRAFRTRVGIGFGPVTSALVGGVDGRWEVIAEGPAFAEAVRSSKGAGAGTVRVSTTAWSALTGHADGTPHADGNVTIDRILHAATPRAVSVPDVPDDVLLPHVPRPVRSRMLHPDAEWLAEMRSVTVLLCALPSGDVADPLVLERVHATVAAFQRIVAGLEGTARVDMDDKGALLLAVWGLPPLAHENDAERALTAARSVHDAMRTAGFDVGVGVATGRALCGAFGSDRRRDYIVRGDVINLAARLMDQPARDVVCDHASVQATRGRMSFTDNAHVDAKGRTGAIPTFVPLGRVGAQADASNPLIGRAEELATLFGAVTRVCGGIGSMIVVEGEAGLGKSRLLAEAAAAARSQNVRVIVAAADAIDAGTAYFAWRSAFATIFDVGPSTSLDEARARVMAMAGDVPDNARLLPLLNAVLPLQLPDNELTAEMHGDVRADNTARLLSAILRRESERSPMTMLVEDAHWLDASSWKVLLETVASAPALLTILATRAIDEPVPLQYTQLTARAASLLKLEGLSDDDTLSLIRQRLDVVDVPAALRDFVLGRVAGHPFFCEELLHALRDAGVVRVEDGRCVVQNLDAIDVPPTVEGVILSRLDRLAADQLMCLKIAAVIGRSFRVDTVTATHPVATQRAGVTERLEDIAKLELTTLEVPEPDTAYIFKHVITRDVTYDIMPLAQQQPLHRAVAGWYEQRYTDDLSPFYSLLAYHWARAADPVRTAHFLELAGAQAVRDGAFQQALLSFTQVSALHRQGAIPADSARIAMWEKAIATAHYFLGDLAASQRHLENAVALVDAPVPTRPAAVNVALIGALTRQVAHRYRPRRFAGRRSGEKGVLNEVVDCYKILGQIYYLNGESAQRLVYCTLRGLNLGEEAGSSPSLARILSNTATLLSLLGLNGIAERYAGRAIRMAEVEGQYSAGAYVWSINALREAQLGRWRAAHAANRRSLALVQALGDYNVEAECWVIAATIAICEGDFASAPVAWRHARELAERRGNTQILCWSLLDEVDTLLGTGDTAGAARVLEDALAIETAASDGGSTIDKHRATAVTRARQNRFDEAVAAADMVVDMVASQPPTGYHWVDFCASAVEVYFNAIEHSTGAGRVALEKKARRGCRVVMKLSRNFWNVRPRAWLLRGMLEMHDAKPALARASWQRAVALGAEMDMPFEQARAWSALARTGLDVSHADDARKILQGLGATYYLGRI